MTTKPTLSLAASTHAAGPLAGGAELPEQFGRYRIVTRLGQGGMGSVYKAHDAELDRPVALKVPHFGPDADSDLRERFQREARAAARIEHPNICPVYDVGQIDGVHYVTMALIEGRALSEVIQSGKPLPQKSVAALTRKLALALQQIGRAHV